MATTPHVTLQELRALLIYDNLPAACVAHLIADDHSAPHLRPGEFAVVDTCDRQPARGELFVIRCNGGRQQVVQAWPRQMHDGQGGERTAWWVGDMDRPRSLDEAMHQLRSRDLGTSDGPYRLDHLASKLVGRVVGVLAPVFEEPKRLGVTS